MLKNKILEKLLAIILIFTLTFVNFAFVTNAYASSIAVNLFGSKSDTGHENVEFNAYFETEEKESSSVISDVNNKELAISMDLKVKNAGYLKDAKVEIAEGKEGEGINFCLKEVEELKDYVQEVSENVLTLQQVNNQEEAKIVVPIEYKNEKFFNEEDLSKDCKVRFSGIYVDKEGNEVEIFKEVILNVSWNDKREAKIETEVTKYISLGDGIIVQTLVRVNTETEQSTLPIKESEISIDVPEVKGIYPTNIYVVANSTVGTNGKTVGEVEFNEDNWNYNEDEKKLTIKVNNKKQLVEVNEHVDEYLQDLEKEIIREERLFNGNGTDEYLVTYTYRNVSVEEDPINISSSINVKTISYGNDNSSINLVQKVIDYELVGKIGDVVSLYNEVKTPEVSKSYVYFNYEKNGKYETEFKTETVINISHKDIIENLIVEDVNYSYIDKMGNETDNNDIYYKQISISKENFDNVLGENGSIKVKDMNGNEVSTIDNSAEVDEEGNIVLNFKNENSRLSFEISKPISEGNLILTNTKAMKNSSLSKEEFSNIEKIKNVVVIKANNDNVIENISNEVILKDTVTKAEIVMNKESLSTVSGNDDVEVRIKLNNHTLESDVYGHSIFEFDIPEYIEVFDIKNAELVYAEGLSLSSVNVEDKKVRIELNGVQENINSCVLTGGTNIVLNVNIKVSLYTPAKVDKIELRYTNDKATNYYNEGKDVFEFEYSAPKGLVTINSTYNYNDEGTVLTSVRQGVQKDLINVYAESKVATMELIVINNNSNKVSNVSLLGRIPFKGNRDIETNEDLKTTLDTQMVNGIVSDERNNTKFEIYYSENGNATKDLEDEENKWNKNPEAFDNVKSFLIVPEDDSYEMNETDTLRFKYEYTIPANMPHNEYIYGTFGVYYTNNSELATTEEISVADLICLTTGKGPELKIDVELDKEVVKGFEELRAKVIIKNVGEEIATEVLSNITIPEYVEYEYFLSDVDGITGEKVGNKFFIDYCPDIQIGEEISYTVVTTGKKYPTIEEYYMMTPGFIKNEDGSYSIKKYIDKEDGTQELIEEKIEELPDILLDFQATVTAKDLGAEIKSEIKSVKLEEAEFYTGDYFYDTAIPTKVNDIGTEFQIGLNVQNLSLDNKDDFTVEIKVPYELDFVSGEITDEFGTVLADTIYDDNSKTVYWKNDVIGSGRYIKVKATFRVARLEDGITEKDVSIIPEIYAKDTDKYLSGKLDLKVGKAVLVATQSTLTTNTYVKEGNTILYVFNIKNEGSVKANRVEFVDKIPDGLVAKKISYTVNGVESTSRVSGKEDAMVSLIISPKSEAIVKVEALAISLNGMQEKSVTNYAELTAQNAESIKTNSITHIVEAVEKVPVTIDPIENVETDEGTTSNSDISKTYKINGLAWLDENRNGMRDNNEQLLSGITVRLVNSESGVIVSSVTTDSKGNYVFSGVKNGNYLIVFYYDTAKYTVTTYHKENIASNVNSDAIVAKIEQDGKEISAAITDTITVSNGSISNIDIGLVYANIFDLSLTKGISKVTTQTKQRTESQTYTNASIAKTEIRAKNLIGSVVYVEYAITVKNEGDISGYAKKVVDYLPEGMAFNSSLEENKGWYTGTDGNLYNDELANIELAPGESRKLTLVLSKTMTDTNTGIVNNLAEIYEDYNIYGVTDINSKPANKAQGENDLGSADLAIYVKTGEVFIYISIIITTMLLGSIVVFIVYNKVLQIKRKEGGV